MRADWFVAYSLALLCAACAAGTVRRDDPTPDFYVPSAQGEPAGYYPGRQAPLYSRTPEFTAWLVQNRDGIAEIQRRIDEIKDGRRKPGCIGEDKYTCVATLAQKMAIADSYASGEADVFAEPRHDVNGRPLADFAVVVDGYLPNADKSHKLGRTRFALRFGPKATVRSVEAKLPTDVTLARTQEEYDAALAYETIAAVTARTCPSLRRDEVAKWIENTVKPRLHALPRERRPEVVPLRVHHFTQIASPKIAFCGRSFEFRSERGTIWSGHEREFLDVTRVVVE